MQSPASGKEETLAAIQARAAWRGCISSGSSVGQQQPQGQGAGAKGNPMLAVTSPMGHSPTGLVTRSIDSPRHNK